MVAALSRRRHRNERRKPPEKITGFTRIIACGLDFEQRTAVRKEPAAAERKIFFGISRGQVCFLRLKCPALDFERGTIWYRNLGVKFGGENK